MTPEKQRENILRHFTLLSGGTPAGDPPVFEIRTFNTDAGGGGVDEIGYFNNAAKLVKDALTASSRETCKGVFITLNPVNPSKLSEAPNTLLHGLGSATKDNDILCRRHLLVDIDPIRTSGTNSHESEHNAALERGKAISQQLTAKGWPEPLIGSSGNGCGVTYRLPDLPNDDSSTRLIEAVLKSLSKKFSDEYSVKVDAVVGNASRVCKLYGTKVRKGYHSEQRPHRYSEIISAPNALQAVSVEQLTLLAGIVPGTSLSNAGAQAVASDRQVEENRRNMDAFVAMHGISITAGPISDDGGYQWKLECCPFNPAHRSPDSFLYVKPVYGYGFHCSHDSCRGKRWDAFQAHYEPFRNLPAPPSTTPSPTPAPISSTVQAIPTAPTVQTMTTLQTSTPTPAVPALRVIPDLLLQGGTTTFNDTGNAERIRLFAGDNILWSKDEKSWYVWDGRRYEKNNLAAKGMAEKAIRAFLIQCVHLSDFLKFAVKSLDQSRLANALEGLKHHVAIDVSAFDKDRHLLSCLNGTVNLRTGELREHRQGDRITKLVPHNYDPAATAPAFLKFLREILPEPTQQGQGMLRDVNVPSPTLIECIQIALGSAITGEVSHKSMVICHGATGNNGKTTLLHAVSKVIPEHSTRVMINSLMVSFQGEDNNSLADMADLLGSRFVFTSEPKEGQHLNAAKIKQIVSGEDTIKTARKYENTIQFTATHTLFMDCNQLPVISGSDRAMWSRMYCIPFNVEIPENRIDSSLPEKLQREAAGILAWQVAGAMKFYQQGGRLSHHASSEDAKRDWQEETDIVKPFLDDMCTVDPSNPSLVYKSSDLWAAYVTWSDRQPDHKRLSQIGFAANLLSKGLPKDRIGSSRTRVVLGICPKVVGERIHRVV